MNNNAFISKEELDRLFQSLPEEDPKKDIDNSATIEYSVPEEFLKLELPSDTEKDFLSYLKSSSHLEELVLEFELSSEGRFGPSTIKATDFRTGDLEEFLKIQRDPFSIFGILISILDKRIVYPEKIQTAYLPINDVLEILLQLRYNFFGSKIDLDIPCDNCTNELQKDFSFKSKLDLSEVPLLSIQYSENKLRELYRKALPLLSEERFLSIFKMEKTSENIEKFLNEYKIKHDFSIYLDTEYKFRISYFGDLAYGFYVASKKYSPFIKDLKLKISKTKDEQKLIELNAQLEEANQNLLEEAQLIMKALTLESVGNTLLSNLEKRLTYYKNLPLKVLTLSNEFKNSIQYSICGDLVVECPRCKSTIRRSLRDQLTFISLIPFELAQSSLLSGRGKSDEELPPIIL